MEGSGRRETPCAMGEDMTWATTASFWIGSRVQVL
jgi:hypothetical protein